MDLGAMAMKECSTFPKASASLEHHSDHLVSYPGHLFGAGDLTPSAEVQLVYSTAPADWAKIFGKK